MKDQCSKYSNVVSDKSTDYESERDDSGAESTDTDEDISDSEGADKPAAKEFLDTLLTAARPWSFNDRWNNIITETGFDSKY